MTTVANLFMQGMVISVQGTQLMVEQGTDPWDKASRSQSIFLVADTLLSYKKEELCRICLVLEFVFLTTYTPRFQDILICCQLSCYHYLINQCVIWCCKYVLKDKNQLTRKVVPKVYPEVINRIEN